ncbi:MAG: hypothetical protein WCP73_03225 [Eubacteriales bacterium]
MAIRTIKTTEIICPACGEAYKNHTKYIDGKVYGCAKCRAHFIVIEYKTVKKFTTLRVKQR